MPKKKTQQLSARDKKLNHIQDLFQQNTFTPTGFATHYRYKNSLSQFCTQLGTYLRQCAGRTPDPEIRAQILATAEDARHYFPEDAELAAYFSKSRLRQQVQISADNVLTESVLCTAAELVSDAKARKRKHNQMDEQPTTPKMQMPTIPTLHQVTQPPCTPLAFLRSGVPSAAVTPDRKTIEWDPEIEIEAPVEAIQTLLLASVANLEHRDPSKDFVYEGVSLQNVLKKVQKALINRREPIAKSQHFQYMAAWSCLVIGEEYPEHLRGLLSDKQFVRLRNAFLEEYAVMPADAEYVHNKNLAKFTEAKVGQRSFRAISKTKALPDGEEKDERIRVARCFDSLDEHLTVLSPMKTGEADYTRKYILPFTGLLKGDELHSYFDCRADTGPERPDIHIKTPKKTRWARPSEVKKELSRVLERLIKCFQDEIQHHYHENVPKFGIAFHAVKVGAVSVVNCIPRESQELLGSAIRGWRGLRTTLLGTVAKMKDPAPESTNARKILPPYLMKTGTKWSVVNPRE
ncbi:hypothetical protein HDU85_004937 [Gaertneriomyces sp. JEL0708]|nr:hypothetical protein HDU85_004937 [Gaertneriomyces sp. JEL0708]